MDEPRAANVLAKSNVSLMALDRQDFESLLGHGHLRSMIDYNMGIRVLQCVSIFKSLSASEREQVFSALQLVSFKRGATIVREGAKNNTFFIIKDGTVKASGGTGDPVELEHRHEATAHEHLHVHDEHHQHEHQGWEGPEPHRHPHRHRPVRHKHAFVIDLHHLSWPLR